MGNRAQKRQRREEARRALTNSPTQHSPPTQNSPPHQHSPDAPSEPPSPPPDRIGVGVDLQSPRLEKLLKAARQRRVISWDELGQEILQSLSTMSGGKYGSVYGSMYQGIRSVVKVVPVSETKTTAFGGYSDLEFVTNEFMINSYLKDNQSVMNNPGVVHVIKVLLVRGVLPEVMRIAMPDKPTTQLYFVTITRNGGSPLKEFKVSNLLQFKCIISQILVSLVLMEKDMRFEHRDLHNKNILVQKCSSRNIEFGVGKEKVLVSSGGVRTCLIDFTMSRATIHGHRYFVDLSQHGSMFRPDAKKPSEKARNEMLKCTGGRWAEFNASSNACWIRMQGERLLKNAGRFGPYRWMMSHWLNKVLEKQTVKDMLSVVNKDIVRK